MFVIEKLLEQEAPEKECTPTVRSMPLGFPRSRLALNHTARRAAMCAASGVDGELHPAKIV